MAPYLFLAGNDSPGFLNVLAVIPKGPRSIGFCALTRGAELERRHSICHCVRDDTTHSRG